MAEIYKLIDQPDSFEVVRDQIAAVLADELANQRLLAKAAGSDPELFRLRVYTERYQPWVMQQGASGDVMPIVNVYYDSGAFPKGRGDVVKRQLHSAVFNIDCYAGGIAEDNSISGGHTASDLRAAKEVHRAIRLVRNILMSASNTYLQMRGLVQGRWIRDIIVFHPVFEGVQVFGVIGARIGFEVEFNEFSAQYDPGVLKQVSVDVHRALDGQVIAQSDFDFSGAG